MPIFLTLIWKACALKIDRALICTILVKLSSSDQPVNRRNCAPTPSFTQRRVKRTSCSFGANDCFSDGCAA